MSPDSFLGMESIVLFEGNIVATEIMFFHIVGHLCFTFFLEFFNNGQVNIRNIFL